MSEFESSQLLGAAAALSAELAEADGEPVGGAVAALAVALAAALVAATANHSRSGWPEAPGVRAQAKALRQRALTLAQGDIDAYAEARKALAGRSASSDLDLGQVVSLAAQVPQRIAEAAGDVAELAAAVADHGDPELRADAAIAAILAAGAARSAAHLVEINLVAGANPELVKQAADRAGTAERSAAAAQRL